MKRRKEYMKRHGIRQLDFALDLFNGEIINYSITIRPHLGQVIEMLDLVFEKHKDLDGLILHSNQGWKYQHKTFQCLLKE